MPTFTPSHLGKWESLFTDLVDGEGSALTEEGIWMLGAKYEPSWESRFHRGDQSKQVSLHQPKAPDSMRQTLPQKSERWHPLQNRALNTVALDPLSG